MIIGSSSFVSLLTLLLLIAASAASVTAPAKPITRQCVQKEAFSRQSFRVLTIVRGGEAVTDLELAVEAFDWCSNLGAPAALVGGAVLATLIETRKDLAPHKNDKYRIRKQITRVLLLSAFALEIMSIFATTVTGTMLLAQGDKPTGSEAGMAYHSPMGWLRYNHEFEYLTARITFLQGLFHWLAATALDTSIPKHGEGESARRMNDFISSSLLTMSLVMLSFYNAHMTFYKNYAHMLLTYLRVLWKRFFATPRPMMVLYFPSLAWTLRSGFRAFLSPSDMDFESED